LALRETSFTALSCQVQGAALSEKPYALAKLAQYALRLRNEIRLRGNHRTDCHAFVGPAGLTAAWNIAQFAVKKRLILAASRFLSGGKRNQPLRGAVFSL
jgi:hypothetical protein